jgi:hypothetical protein
MSLLLLELEAIMVPTLKYGEILIFDGHAKEKSIVQSFSFFCLLVKNVKVNKQDNFS